MNNPKTFAKIILAALGIFLLIRVIPQFAVMVVFLCSSFWRGFEPGSYLLMIPLLGLWIFLIFRLFLWKRDRFADWIVKDIESDTADVSPAGWIHFGFRMACFVAGLLVSYKFIINVQNIFRYILLLTKEGHQGELSYLLNALGIILLLPFAIYLLYGAPGFVRWQVDRTLEICNEYRSSEKQENASGS